MCDRGLRWFSTDGEGLRVVYLGDTVSETEPIGAFPYVAQFGGYRGGHFNDHLVIACQERHDSEFWTVQIGSSLLSVVRLRGTLMENCGRSKCSTIRSIIRMTSMWTLPGALHVAQWVV